MNKQRPVKFIFLASVFNLVASISFGDTIAVNTPQRLTTHTAEDYQPAVSNDGKSIAFVSNRSGNTDIWLIPIDGGPARQLTKHTASDTDPAWSRDGKRLAFTSLRDDSKGDIWVLDLESNTETRIIGSKSAETYPSWFPDGKKVAFSRGEEVWSIDLQTRSEELLFKGFYPSVSPDGKNIAFISFSEKSGVSTLKGIKSQESENGVLWVYQVDDGKPYRFSSGEYSDAFPSWSPDGKEIYFSRFSEDTDNDGIIDVKDNPSIWKIGFTDSPKLATLATQLTSGSSYDLFPSIIDNSLIYSASRGKDLDIYSILKNGEIPHLRTAREQLDLAHKIREPWQAILAFRKACISTVGAGSPRPYDTRISEDEGIFAEARYRVGLKYLEIGHKKDAEREFEALISSSPKERKYVSLAGIEISKLRTVVLSKEGALEEIKKLRDIIGEHKEQPYTQAMAQLEIGNIYLSLKDDVQALKEYEKVRELYPGEVEPVAQARLKMADMYSSYGDVGRFTDAYISIIKDYPDSSEWGITASQRVVSLIERIEDERERLSRYREIVSRFKGLPYLPAFAQYKAGEFYHTKGSYDEALSEYRRVLDGFSSDTEIVSEASIAIAEVELSKKAYSNALVIYEGLIKKGDARARKLYINAALEKGRAELFGKEPAQAIKTFKAIIDLDYNEVRAHRGLIEAYAMKGEPEKAVAIYSEDVKKLPESDVAHYGLGLAYTYIMGTVPDLRTERSGVVESGLSPLKAAESELKKALSINYSFPFAHQTLGWVYEIKEKTGAAVDEYQAALALLAPDQKQQAADLLLNIGNGYSALGNHEKGYEFYKKRLETGVSFDDQKREAFFYENLGNEASRTGQYTEAVPYYTKAINHAVKVKDKNWQLKITEEIALLYQETKDYPKAVEYFTKALKISEEQKMAEKKPLLLRNIAYNLYHAGKPDEAISYFNKSLDALKVKEESAEGSGLLTIKKAMSLGKEGSEAFKGFEKEGEEKLIYSYLGKAYADTGEYEAALAELLKKLERIPEERETEKGIVLNNIGFLYYQMGDVGNAYRYFRDSMTLFGKAKNFSGEMSNIINLGLLAAQEEITPPPSAPPLNLRGGWGELGNAVSLQERGISLIESEKRGNEYLPYLKNNLGLLYLTRGLSLFTDAVKRSRRIGTVPGPASSDLTSIVISSLDSINQDRDHLKKASDYFRDGLKLENKKKDPWLEAVLELNLSTALYHYGHDKDASEALVSATKIIETNSLTDLKWRGLWLLSRLGDENRLKHLEDSIASLEGRITKTPPNPLFIKEHPSGYKGVPKAGELRVELGLSPVRETAYLYKELISLLFSAGNFDEAFSYAERMEIGRMKSDAARARYPLPKMEEPLSARDAQWFLDDKTAIVRYLQTESGLLVWVIDSDNIQGRILPVSQDEIKEGVDGLLSTLDKKQINDLLSPVIIQPIAELISARKKVIVIPDETLASVPFSVLRIGKDSMIDRFETAYVPSAVVFNAAYEKRNLNKVNILISQSDKYSDDYVEGIGAKTPIFAALKSDKTKFLDMASNYGMLHITDDLSINQAAPFRSFIQFGKKRLSLSELMPLKMNPNLVVITSINPPSPPFSKGGKIESPPLTKGDSGGFAGTMSQALTPLVLSGAPSVLVKTIPTDKVSEELFMKEFYDAFRTESAAGALAKAQRSLKAKGMSPDVWAGYALYGYTGMNKEEERKYASQKVAEIMNAAIEAYSKGEWKVAVKKFEEGLLFLKAVGAKENLGNIYQALAKAGANSGEYAKGAYYQDEFIKVSSAKLPKTELADSYKTLGILYSRAGEGNKAETALNEALKIWKEIGNKKSMSEGYRTLALLQERGGSYQSSLSSFNNALNIDRELSDTASVGQDLWDIGRIYYLRLSRFDEALNAYNESLSVFKGLGYKEKMAGVFMDIGLVHEQEGEYESARAGYLEGITIADEINDKRTFSRGNLYLANVAWHTGDYQEAFKYQKIALDLAIMLKDRKQEAMAYNLTGLTYMNLGMLEKALEHLSKSLAISIDTGDRLDAAAAYNNIGIVHRELGDINRSIESFKSALIIDTEINTKWGMAYDMRNLGISLERSGTLDDALNNLQASLVLSREIGERKNEAMALFSLGMLYMTTGRSSEASRTLKDAYSLGKELNLPEVTWRSLKALAVLDIQGSKLTEGYAELKEAIEVVERMRGRIKVDEYKTGFLENKADLYEDMVLLLLRMGRVEEALNYAERARSRNFIDMLGNQKINLKSVASRALLDRERSLRGRIESLEERARGNSVLLEELTTARKDYESLLIEIKAESLELASFVTVEPPAIGDIQKTISKDAVLLEYMVTKDSVVIWAIGKDRIDSVLVPVEREALKEKVVRYRDLMEKVTPLEKESMELYDLLVRPVEKLIEGTRYVGIIPHDVLHYISFSSLFDGKRYLMEEHPIFYAPSAGVLKMIADRRTPHPSPLPRGEGVKMLVIGNPDLGDSAYDLPFAEREAGSIGREFEGSELLLRTDATETKVKEEIGGFDGVHFASHGVYDSVTPLFSTLKLTRDSSNDGNLTANEIFSLNLNANLAMMSACQTGLGKVTTGDEIIGLNRAFIYAGAPSIISTLWRVNDAASAMLVKRFYRSYKSVDIAESLRNAQMAVKEYYPHPAYWAGFGLTGGYR